MKPIQFTITREVWKRAHKDVKALFPDKQVDVGYLLSTTSKKAKLADKVGVIDAILYLSPAETVVKGLNLCTSSTKGCRRACIAWTGQLRLPRGRKALIARTLFWACYPELFCERLDLETSKLVKQAERENKALAIRLNGTSDIAWETSNGLCYLQHAMLTFPSVQYYDYTKHVGRCFDGYRKRMGVPNYHLTYSWKGQPETALKRLDPDISIAVPFAYELPETFLGRKVIDGDTHDLRYLDEPGVVVGLAYKRAKHPTQPRMLRANELPEFVVQAA